MEILFNPILLLLATAKDVLPVLGLLVVFQTQGYNYPKLQIA